MAALLGIVLRDQPLHRHADKIRIAAGGGAIGEGDLQDFGEVMDGLRGAEAECCDIVALQNIQHLRDVHAGGGGRRRPENLPAAIIGADRRALDGLVGGQVLARDEAAIRLHVIGEDVAKRTVIERGVAML